MLVLARKLHQSILIGDTIRITVLEVRDGQVRLGIDAPRGVSVLREEIIQDAATANRQACLGAVSGTQALNRMTALLRLQPVADEPDRGD